MEETAAGTTSSAALDGADAPGDLAMVEAFVNTRDVEAGTDALHDPAALAQWLADHRLADIRSRPGDPADVRRITAVREALRALLSANHDGTTPPHAATALLAREARACPVVIDFRDAGAPGLTPAGTGLDAALAALLAIVFHAMHDGTWRRLKVCGNETCRWAFYDASRNRSGRWCSMAVCGNRSKVSRYRRRHHGADG